MTDWNRCMRCSAQWPSRYPGQRPVKCPRCFSVNWHKPPTQAKRPRTRPASTTPSPDATAASATPRSQTP